jgi:hypothetical protein
LFVVDGVWARCCPGEEEPAACPSSHST